MLDKTFIEKIEDLSDPKIFKDVYPRGQAYSSKPLVMVKAPEAEPLEVSSLEALASYVMRSEDVDGPSETNLIVHVSKHDRVDIVSPLFYSTRQRETLVKCRMVHTPFPFGEEMSVEKFVIALQAMFVQDETTAEILRVVGNLKAEASATMADDGTTQVVTTKKGVAGLTRTSVPNPVTLRPYRTFLEVEQPASRFVFRMKMSDDMALVKCSLHEADGGMWKNTAMASIKMWLESALSGKPSVIIIG